MIAVEDDAAALLACDREPIRTPAAIQPRGLLLALAPDDLCVRFASDNAEGYLGASARDLLGQRLGELSPAIAASAHALLADHATGRPARLLLDGGRPVDVFAHRSGGQLIVELEDVLDETATLDEFQDGVLDTLGRLQRSDGIDELLEIAVGIVRELTGFDRVLAYRFVEGGHGVVEHEQRAEGLASLLGQHFPASDIPAQARALYREQWLRVIPDSAAEAIGLIGDDAAGPADAVDLSGAVLRAVSPVHLQYLRNMGVRASLSVSLVVDGVLWGLIVCHHHQASRLVSYRVRAACEIVGITASMSIATRSELAAAEQRLALERVGVALLERVAGARSVAEGLLEDPALLLGACAATGVAVRIGGALRRAGSAPPEHDVDRIRDAIRDGLDAGGGEYSTDRLGLEHPGLADLAGPASGVLALDLTRDGANSILWFRPELISTVTWAGQPEKERELAADGSLRIGPRRSFAAWAEELRGRSKPWGAAELSAVATLRSTLGTFVLERAEQIAYALQSARAYDREHYVARTLKESLQPAELPAIADLDVASLYLPAGEGYGVSGDFLEVFPARDGWFAVIGDVCGKGPEAAGLTALARHTLRAVALQDPAIAPSRAISVLNEAIMERAGGLFASVLVARVTPRRDGSARVVLCSAGHPPALVRQGASVTAHMSRNVLVGAKRGLAYSDVELELGSGDAIVLYTDGVTEAGRPAALFGEQGLIDAIGGAGAGADSAAIIDAIDGAIHGHQVGELRDDVAVLCLRTRAPTS